MMASSSYVAARKAPCEEVEDFYGTAGSAARAFSLAAFSVACPTAVHSYVLRHVSALAQPLRKARGLISFAFFLSLSSDHGSRRRLLLLVLLLCLGDIDIYRFQQRERSVRGLSRSSRRRRSVRDSAMLMV